MYRAISFILYVIYKLYEQTKRDKQGAYELAIFLFLVVVFLNVLIVLTLSNALDSFTLWNLSDPKSVQFLKAGSIFLPAYLIMALIFRKKYIINLHYEEETIFWRKVIVVINIIISFVTVIALAIYRVATK